MYKSKGFQLIPQTFEMICGSLSLAYSKISLLQDLIQQKHNNNNQVSFNKDNVFLENKQYEEQLGLTTWTPFDLTHTGIQDINRISEAPLRWVSSTSLTESSNKIIQSHHQLSRGGEEMYCTLYHSEHFLEHFLFHLQCAYQQQVTFFAVSHILDIYNDLFWFSCIN